MQPEPDPNNPNRVEEFVELLTRNDQALSSYVLSLVPSSSDAQDILQETKLALWRSFGNFELGTDFGAWARRAALNRVLDFRKRKSRENKHLWFSDQCYQFLAAEYELDTERREERMHRLKDCIDKLTYRHRQILVLRYFHDASIEEVAAQVERSVDATYRVLSRIRLTLRKCLTAKSI
jgi:RNA polymerase sigma-70 factor (ECF subfamily)